MSEALQGLAKHWPLVPFFALYGVSRLIVRTSAQFLTEENRATMQAARSALGTLIGMLLLIPIGLAFFDLRAALVAWAGYTLFAVTYNFVWCTRFGLPRQYRNRAAVGNLVLLLGIAVLGIGYFWPVSGA